MGDFIFGELLFGSWTETNKAITIHNPINDYDMWIPKKAVKELTKHYWDHWENSHYAQEIQLEEWFLPMIDRQRKEPSNNNRFNAGVIYFAINKNAEYYINEKKKIADVLKPLHPTGLP